MSAATAASPTRRNRKRVTPARVLLHIFLITFALIWLVPVAWALLTSFRSYATRRSTATSRGPIM